MENENTGKEYIKHIVCEGSREHVTYWDTYGQWCSVKNCEINKPREVISITGKKYMVERED